MKPNAKSVTTALRKVKDLPYTLIANGHGPMLRWGETPPGDPLSRSVRRVLTG